MPSVQIDPKLAALIQLYRVAKEDMRRNGGRLPKERAQDPRIIAGWALNLHQGDVLGAIEEVRKLQIDGKQRSETLDVLREHVRQFDLTRPISKAH